MLSLYTAIWHVSGRRQIVLILLSIAIAALAAVPLSFQKDIINALTSGHLKTDILVRLCTGMVLIIMLSLALKWVLGYRVSILGEDVIRLLRNRIYSGSVKDKSDGRDSIPTGTLATVISAESEELGKFTGSAFSEPVVQVGTLISVVGFIASTQPLLGGIALLMIVPQVILVLFTQAPVNRLVAERVRVLRHSTNLITSSKADELVDEVLANFDTIYETRRRIFVWKLSTKFILSSINGAGTVSVLLLGGFMVIEGRTDVGTVVAATIGLGRLQGPTAFLIAFYRQVSATRVKFELLRGVRHTSAPTP
ncbi:MAG: ABC-type bacteriocin/lantibiotic exporter with double-glycine peptidase domain [Paracoccaceae bacterium]|jgi:ABC-type bacteriocin/lantibiotic exporter with double-glycine peptidase domain